MKIVVLKGNPRKGGKHTDGRHASWDAACAQMQI